MSDPGTALVQRRNTSIATEADGYGQEQVELIKRTIAFGSTDDELKLFIATAKRLHLDPFAKQIYSISRWDERVNGYVRQVQVSIDGLRLIAERTGRYRPADELPDFRYNGKNELLAAVVYVWKLYGDAWYKCPSIAFFDEYAGRKRDGGLTKMWAEKAHIMLAKCAEAAAIRKAFPNETSGAYVPEEMDGDVIDVESTPTPQPTAPPPKPVAPAPPPAPPAARGPGPSAKAQAMLEEEAKRQGPRNTSVPATAAALPKPDPKPPRPAAGPAPSAAIPPAAERVSGPAAPVAAPAPANGNGDEAFGPSDGEAKASAPAEVADVPFEELPPAPATAQKERPVDIVFASFVSATTMADYLACRKEMQNLEADERDWVMPELINALIRIVEKGPEEDVDAAFAAIGRARAAKMLPEPKRVRAEASYRARKDAINQ